MQIVTDLQRREKYIKYQKAVNKTSGFTKFKYEEQIGRNLANIRAQVNVRSGDMSSFNAGTNGGGGLLMHDIFGEEEETKGEDT